VNDLKNVMQDNYLRYASYVILERAIPDALDGLKPVQRRILHALKLMHDGKLHKVANVVGQTMPFHPHGDAPIYEALVNLANKEVLLERQGNFGNPHTGDPAAAARYIETRLLPLANETLFNSRLTEWTPSYDGRAQEPVRLPVKIPLLLLMGAEGIAVGMATRIFSHNLKELLEAQIAYLKDEPFLLFPDFSLKEKSYTDQQNNIFAF
jgi:topoisomerase-4 subunit A